MATSRWVTLFSIWDRGTAELLPEVLKKEKVGQSVLGEKGGCMTPWWMGAYSHWVFLDCHCSSHCCGSTWTRRWRIWAGRRRRGRRQERWIGRGGWEEGRARRLGTGAESAARGPEPALRGPLAGGGGYRGFVVVVVVIVMVVVVLCVLCRRQWSVVGVQTWCMS